MGGMELARDWHCLCHLQIWGKIKSHYGWFSKETQSSAAPVRGRGYLVPVRGRGYLVPY